MLRIIQSGSAQAAKSYYASSLSVGDYYSDGQEIVGHWGGEAASRLGLSGPVSKEAFDALCENRQPATGDRLTARDREGRRVGYDFNFHSPKSASILYAMTGDSRILDAFQSAVQDTMKELEKEAATRVRKGGADERRETGNLVWAEFTHLTARPVGGIPDMHLHSHCFVFNGTWDAKEGMWKAADVSDIKRDASYYEAGFHARFAGNLTAQGFAIERTAKGWEVAGISAINPKFSRRTAQIDALAEAKGITSAKQKDKLGASSRSRKGEPFSMEELRELWTMRLTPEEGGAIIRASRGEGKTVDGSPVTARASLDYAADHCFERASVVSEKQLMAAALRHGVGSVSVDQVKREAQRPGIITKEVEGQRRTTTRRVLCEEKEMLDFCRSGRGTCRPLVPGKYEFSRPHLTAGQKAAVRHVLGSYDRVSVIRGAAGTGKTTLMQEATEAIEATGKSVHVFAPSAEASRGVLRQEGFAGAETVAKLLQDQKLQAGLKGSVVWIDEAGQLGTRTLKQVTDLAHKCEFRLVLSGDAKQHGSVERGDALRLLQDQAGLPVVEVTEIKRQRGDYKKAIQALSRGDVETGLARLDAIGFVKEIGDETRHKRLAADYLDAVSDKKTALVVSPTRAEGDRVTTEIRSGLRQKGWLAPDERKVTRLVDRSLTEAERGNPLSYRDGDVVIFTRAGGGHMAGARLTVTGRDEAGRIIADKEGSGPTMLPLNAAARFQVYERSEIALAAGDTIRMTKNMKTADRRHEVNNGAMYELAGFEENGDLHLKNGWTISKDSGHVTHGYVTTSHASQGKTVDRVFIAQGSESAGAASREQLYVSASRAKERCTIYTDDKDALLSAAKRSGVRMAATELAAEGSHPSRKGRLQEHAELVIRLASVARAYAAQKLDDIRDGIGKIQERMRTPEMQRGHER